MNAGGITSGMSSVSSSSSPTSLPGLRIANFVLTLNASFSAASRASTSSVRSSPRSSFFSGVDENLTKRITDGRKIPTGRRRRASQTWGQRTHHHERGRRDHRYDGERVC